MILVYVDDILVTSDDHKKVQQLIHSLHDKFSLKHLGEINYFLGLEAHVTAECIRLTQSKYVKDLLLRTNLLNSKSCPTPSCPNKKLSLHDCAPFSDPTLFRSVVGALQYLTLTRPDIAFFVIKLSQYLQNPSHNHCKMCKRVLKYLKGSMYFGLSFCFPFQVIWICRRRLCCKSGWSSKHQWLVH